MTRYRPKRTIQPLQPAYGSRQLSSFKDLRLSQEELTAVDDLAEKARELRARDSLDRLTARFSNCAILKKSKYLH